MNQKVIRVSITIDNNNQDGVKLSANVYDILFTEYSEIIDSARLLERVTKTIKQLGGWSMITVDANMKDSGDYTPPRPREILHSIRYVNEYGRVRQMEWTNDEKFMDSIEYKSERDARKAIANSVQWACQRANESLVKSIRNS
jgi:hypothetical protein